MWSVKEAGENGTGHTKLLFAIFVEHPALILELKGISKNWKSLRARRNFAPGASCILYHYNYGNAKNDTNVGS